MPRNRKHRKRDRRIRKEIKESQLDKAVQIKIKYHHPQFICIDRYRHVIHKLIVPGYIRNISDFIYPPHIVTLCRQYTEVSDNFSSQIEPELLPRLLFEKEIRLDAACNFIDNWHSTCGKVRKYNKLLFNDTFNALPNFEKHILCKYIINQIKRSKLPIHLYVYHWNESSFADQLYFIQYILLHCHKYFEKIDLSDMNLRNKDITRICHAFQDILRYIEQEEQQKINEERQLAAKELSNLDIPVLYKNKKAQKEYERQVRQQQEELMNTNDKSNNIRIYMSKLTNINLSINQISDACIPYLLRTLKRYAPEMLMLELSDNNLTNKVITQILRCKVGRMRVNICKNNDDISVKELIKYQRMAAVDDHIEANVYCYGMIIYSSPNQADDAVSNKEIRHQKGKTKRIRSRKARAARKTQGMETDPTREGSR